MQRMWMLLMGVGCLFFLWEITAGYQQERQVMQWEETEIDRLVEQICRKQEYTYMEYQGMFEKMLSVTEVREIQIKEYRRMTDYFGKEYHDVVSWEEIKRILVEEGRYLPWEDSIIELVTITGSGAKHRYFGQCMGE